MRKLALLLAAGGLATLSPPTVQAAGPLPGPGVAPQIESDVMPVWHIRCHYRRTSGWSCPRYRAYPYPYPLFPFFFYPGPGPRYWHDRWHSRRW
jgi:hypothetical protein